MSALSNNHFSVDDQTADVISWLSNNTDYHDVMERFVQEFPEYNKLEWSGSWVDTENSGVDADYMNWVRDWLETNTPVYWEEGEPWIDSDAENDSLNDYWCDGHYISAETPESAKAECVALYGHDPQIVREWTMEDQAELNKRNL